VPVVVTFPFSAIWFALREIPETPDVERAPLKVARPPIFDAVMEAALIAPAVMFVAAVMERAFKGVVLPKFPLNWMFPAPALIVRF
jgi:hypothetical protein